MKIKIETYRGYDIFFENEEEVFISVITDDKQKVSKSFKAVKNAIDDYIKDNQKFKPFFAVPTPDNHFNHKGNKSLIEIIGIRKDGRFVFKNKKGEKEQMSDFDEDKFMLIEPENDKIFAKIAVLELEKDDIYKKIEAAKRQLKITTIESIKANYLI